MPLPKQSFLTFSLCFLLLSLSFTLSSKARDQENASGDEKLRSLMEERWQNSLKEYPKFATYTGDHRYNDKLQRVSLADSARRHRQTKQYRARLEAVDSASLSKAAKIEQELLLRKLAEEIAEYEFGDHLMPVSGRTGFHISFPELPDEVPLRTVKDYENYVARLNAFEDYANGYMALLREGVRRELTVPAITLEGFSDAIEAQIVSDPKSSLLYKPMNQLPKTFSKNDSARLDAAIQSAISKVVVPSYQRFLDFMTNEYVPNCRTTVGASALPKGRDYYRYRVRKFTTLDMTPEEVHQRGLAEVARIRGEMDAIIRQVEFEGDFASFVDYLRKEPKFYAKSEEELLAAAASILKRADGKMPSLFGTLPRMSYGLKKVPDYIAPKTVAAYYQRPSGDGTKAGFFFLNTFDLSSRPLYMLEALALHEAVPGHHHQLALQQELEGLSPQRKNSGFTAFIEGWALYAERLGLEAGFYEDPYSDFGRLSMEIWRACRLVVDTGVHYLGWTRDEAIEYMRANSAMSDHNIRAEVDRYIGWPGQALAYKTGELKIRELRARCEAELEEKFDVRKFHDAILANGAVPLDVLERLMNEWLLEQKEK